MYLEAEKLDILHIISYILSFLKYTQHALEFCNCVSNDFCAFSYSFSHSIISEGGLDTRACNCAYISPYVCVC